jgi:hypothetical protein
VARIALFSALILPGLWGAIFSSEIGSILGAPRTLQALTADRVVPSRRLIHGHRLPHAKIVNPYDRTIAPIIKGKSNAPVQFGKKPGILAEMATGFIFTLHLPEGNPDDASYVPPLIASVDTAIGAKKLPASLASNRWPAIWPFVRTRSGSRYTRAGFFSAKPAALFISLFIFF